MKIPLIAALLCCATPLAAAEFRFDQSSSTLEFVGQYDGDELPGVFRAFRGTAQFDPTAPLATRFQTEIDIASVDTDYDDRDDVLRGPDWFDAASHPQARWESSGDCVAMDATLQCPGTLSLRGVSKSTPLTLRINTDGSLSGEAQVNRRDFGVGQGEWDDPNTIADLLTVRFVLRAS